MIILTDTRTGAASGTVRLADREVSRVAFGAARLTAGDGWGAPSDLEPRKALLRAAVDAGYTYIDTADALGPGVSEQIIGETLGNREDVVIGSKVGMLRPDARRWIPLGHPDYLRQQILLSLGRLRRDRIDLLYLHRVDPNYPLADQLGALQEAKQRGDVGTIGISEPTAEQLSEALELEPELGAVQSLYNLVARDNAAVAEVARAHGVPFVAYWPLIGRGLRSHHKDALFAALDEIALPLGLTAHQLALAWIFHTQPGSLAIAGSRSVTHLAANQAAAEIEIDAQTVTQVDRAVTLTLGDTPFDPRFAGDEA